MEKKHKTATLASKEMNFFQRLIWRFKYNRTPQITLVHKSGFNWDVYTRRNKKAAWEKRETLRNKKAAAAMKYIRAQYPGYLFYLSDNAIKAAAAAQRKESK